MSDFGYYMDGEKAKGPFSPLELRRLAAEGTITSSTLVRRGSDGTWFEAGRFKEFDSATQTPQSEKQSNLDVRQETSDEATASPLGHSQPRLRLWSRFTRTQLVVAGVALLISGALLVSVRFLKPQAKREQQTVDGVALLAASVPEREKKTTPMRAIERELILSKRLSSECGRRR
ncbi:MAG: DUF4339 domain-containing protein [Planctomycetaceae bacterium]|nr:DUF4339 domain-containing protein [Planctomycetaceae bacterium]